MDKGKISILLIAKYVINYFNENGKKITQLKLQKLLYFIEAYYMNLSNSEELFLEDFKAYTYGPVSFDVYDKYSYYSGYNIIDIYPEVNDDPKLTEFIPVIEEICDKFGKLSASQLVNLTHEKGSPWYKLYVEQNKPLHVIDKQETMKWFKERFAADE